MRSSEAASPLAAVIVSAAVLAQQPSFEAAVFRLNRSGADGSSIGQRSFGRSRRQRGRTAVCHALSEQLGLRLEAGRAPLQTLVIDHIERPSENQRRVHVASVRILIAAAPASPYSGSRCPLAYNRSTLDA
jgi:hypothetical protein